MPDANTTPVFGGTDIGDILSMTNGALEDSYTADADLGTTLTVVHASNDDSNAIVLTAKLNDGTNDGPSVALDSMAAGGAQDVLALLPWTRTDQQGNNYLTLPPGWKLILTADAITSAKYVKVAVIGEVAKLASYT